jgi:large subunit ribosomal protein L9
MKVILREDIHRLGKSGEIVTVKDGFGRNYLLPRKMAMLANEKNLKQVEHDRKVISAQQEAAKLEALSVKITRKVGQQDKLYGSVTSLDIAEALAVQGHRVDRRHIHLPEPLKAIGSHQVELRLHREVSAKITVEVVPE